MMILGPSKEPSGIYNKGEVPMTRPNEILNKLTAVNQLLLCVKEAPVTTLDVPLGSPVLSEAALAEQALDLQVLEVLSDGYPCNQIANRMYAPDSISGKIMLPPTVMQARATDPTYNFTELNGVLFDINNQTDVFTQSYALDLLLFVEFNDLPWQLKNLSMWQAAEVFEKQTRGSPVMNSFIKQKIQESEVYAQKYKSAVGRPSIFDSYRPWSIINRRMNPIGGNLKL